VVPSREPGPRLVELVDKRIDAFAAKYYDLYPAAMRILLTDKAGLTAHLRFPLEHHARVRHSNFIERTFEETKRRTKVIADSPARPPPSAWCGRCSTAPRAAGAASP
jgi:putative transposase